MIDLVEFVKPGEVAYIDEKNNRICKVMKGLGGVWKGRRHDLAKEDMVSGWKCMQNLPWVETRQEAERDLEKLAKKKGWKKVRGIQGGGTVKGVVVGW